MLPNCRPIHEISATESATKILIMKRARAKQVVQISLLQMSIDDMHIEVAEMVTKNRMRQVRVHNKRANIVQPNFSVGDFFSVRRPKKIGHKNRILWIGLRIIVGIQSPLVYQVSRLDSSKAEVTNYARLQHYLTSKKKQRGIRGAHESC